MVRIKCKEDGTTIALKDEQDLPEGWEKVDYFEYYCPGCEEKRLFSVVREQAASNSGCLIVTACFGSPIANEVQYLKNVRDERILQTSAGQKVMKFLEYVYYSFSPQTSRYLMLHDKARSISRSLIASPFVKSVFVSEKISNSVSNKETRVLIMAWLIFVTNLILPLWSILPQRALTSWSRRWGQGVERNRRVESPDRI